jgi:hypothetical protein
LYNGVAAQPTAHVPLENDINARITCTSIVVGGLMYIAIMPGVTTPARKSRRWRLSAK